MNNKGQYFLKDKKAQAYKTVNIQIDENTDYPEKYYVAINPVSMWCYTRQLSQDQLFAAHTYLNDETRFFVFNFRDDIKIYDHIYYDGELYEVTRVDHTDDYNGETFVYVKSTNADKTDIDHLRPCGWKPEDEGLKLFHSESNN